MEVLMQRVSAGRTPTIVRVVAGTGASEQGSRVAVERTAGRRRSQSTEENGNPAVALPAGLSVCRVSCTNQEKDQHLYAFLLKVSVPHPPLCFGACAVRLTSLCLLEQYPGRTLVFVNTIVVLKRLTALLNTLRLPAYALHAGMQQRQRLKNLDRFKSNGRAILVVRGARGSTTQLRLVVRRGTSSQPIEGSVYSVCVTGD